MLSTAKNNDINTKRERPFSNNELSATDQTTVENLLEKVSQKVIKRLSHFEYYTGE